MYKLHYKTCKFECPDIGLKYISFWHNMTSFAFNNYKNLSMKKLLLSIFVVIGLLQLNAQNKQPVVKVYGLPLDTLKSMVHKHPKYFDHLKNKWLKTPAKMTADDMMLLYYGSAFMHGYNPVKEDKAVENIAKLIGEMDFGTAITEGKKLLQVYPLNARLRMLLGYAHKKTGEKTASKYYYKTYGDILRIPLYSGSGKNFDNAFKVRIVSDEYLILNQKDLELVQQEVRFNNKYPFDVLLVKPKSYDNKRMKKLPKEKLYFNIYLPYFIGQSKTYKELQEEAKRKYKISN